jgi:hypothetical protein
MPSEVLLDKPHIAVHLNRGINLARPYMVTVSSEGFLYCCLLFRFLVQFSRMVSIVTW